MNNTNNMRAIHPGEHLREDYLKPLDMSANALALALRVPAPRIYEIVQEKRAISIDTALRLSKFFKTTPEYWLRWQAAFDLKTADKQALDAIYPCDKLTVAT